MPTIRDVVQALARRPGVRAAVVLGEDGLPIDFAGHNGLDSESVAALVPSIVSACAQLGRVVECGEFWGSAVEFQSGMAVVASLGPDTLLTLVVGPEINVGSLLYEIRRHRAAIAGLL
jgi:predicted regulator of Ras-like GTPase activity (Roadblock/LC7/MglB family)